MGILGLAACAILVIGWLVRPHDIPEAPPPVPSETELEQLARRAERRSLENVTHYFARLANEVKASLAYVRDAGKTGIVWDESHVLTAPRPHDPVGTPVSVRTGSGEIEAILRVAGPNLPLASLQVGGGHDGWVAPRRAPSMPHAGDWIVVVWQTDAVPAFAAGTFSQAVPATCDLTTARELTTSVSLTGAMVGGGVFDIDGDLLGAILPCGDRVAAIDAASIDAILERAATVEQHVLALYGVVFARPTPEEQRYFKDEGLFVREVWSDSAGDAAGLRPGDIITAVNGEPIDTTAGLQAFVSAPATPITLKVKRGATALIVPLPPAAMSSGVTAHAPDAGLILESPPSTYRIDAVVPDSPAARAGVRPGDRLVRINGTVPRSLLQVQRTLTDRAPRPILLEIERDARRMAIVIP